MRPPPPLALRCTTSRAWRALCTALSAAAFASFAAWLAGHLDTPPIGATIVATIGVLGAACVGAFVGARFVADQAWPRQAVQVEWDGVTWALDGTRGDLQVMLDLQRWLLLRLQPEAGGRARWCALSRGELGTRGDTWRALRTALYSRRPEVSPAIPALPATRRTPPPGGAAD